MTVIWRIPQDRSADDIAAEIVADWHRRAAITRTAIKARQRRNWHKTQWGQA